MSILQHNGAAIICMAGKNCVAIAADTRFGLQQQTVACDFEKVFKMSDRMFVGLAGLATDVQTLRNTLKFKLALYELREERVMKPEAFSALLSHMLYVCPSPCTFRAVRVFVLRMVLRARTTTTMVRWVRKRHAARRAIHIACM